MARPPKGQDEQLSETLRCRMRPTEYLRLRQQADRAKLTLSDYARRMLLTGHVTIRQVHGLDEDAMEQLRRIGINLNQAVHKLHATGEIPPELARAAAVVEAYILGMIDDGS